MRGIFCAFFVLITFVLVSCSGKGSSAPDASTPDTVIPVVDSGLTVDTGESALSSYHKDVRPLIEVHCLGCHSEGGVGPFALDSYEGLKGMDVAVVSAINGQRMPPWKPTMDCIPLEDERVMTQSEIDIVVKWVEEGSVEGDEADYAPPTNLPVDELGDPDIVTSAVGAYTADASKPDDWRCLPLEHTFEKETFIEVFDVLPDQTEVVHHVLLYLIPAADVPEMENLDAAEDGPGYTCFGGPGLGNGETLGGWVPGSVRGKRSAQPTAMRIPAGARIVMQVHYNVLGLSAGEVPKPDKSEVAMWIMPEGTVPDYLLELSPFPHFGIEIPPHEADWKEAKEFVLPADTVVVGVTPHMHSIGKSIQVDYIRDGQENCIVDIPEWDFNWQQFYRFQDDGQLEMKAGDVIRLSCSYNNSAENQTVVNGVQLDPQTVEWGESTLDEMCLTYLMFMKPYSSVVDQCEGVEACVNDCAEGSTTCFTGCLLGAGTDCAYCVVPEVLECGGAFCPTEGATLLTCAQTCSSVDQACLFQDCAQEFQAYYTCFEPHMKAGECDEVLGDCGVAFTGAGEDSDPGE